MTVRYLPASATLLCVALQCPVLHADPAAAEALFREGRALLERGDLTSACEKLAASNALDPSAGTLLNLAACRLKQGKTATAWAHFVSAERLAQKQSRSEQAGEARRRAAELEPQLSTLTLRAQDAPPGLVVRRTGQLVHSASLGSAVPVDPGPMLIEVSAPGYQTAKLEITVGASNDRRVLELPKLRRISSANGESRSAALGAPPAGEDVAPQSRHRSSAVPWVIGGVGGGALIAGSVLGALALSSNSTAVEQCDAGDEKSCAESQERRDTQALASTICFGVGLAGVGVAAIWLLTGRSEANQSSWSYDGEVTRQSALLKLGVAF